MKGSSSVHKVTCVTFAHILRHKQKLVDMIMGGIGAEGRGGRGGEGSI